MLSKTAQKHNRRIRRHRRVRGKIFGTEACPRFSVYRSNSHIYAQLIDDESGTTLVSSSDLTVKAKGTPSDRARLVGTDIAKNALAKKLGKVAFDRGGFDYSGRIKMLAEGAREGGLLF